jgi:hypothetical protein
MWLRRHDRHNEVASADRFAGAMRVLSRRSGSRTRQTDAIFGARYVMTPRRAAVDHEPLVTATETEDFEVLGPARYAALAAEGRRRIANTKALTARFTDRDQRADEADWRDVEPAPRRRPVTRHEVIGDHASKVAARRRLLIAMFVSFVLSLSVAIARGGLYVGLQVFVDILMLAGFAHMRAEVVAERARLRRVARRRPAVRVAEPAESRREAPAPAAQTPPPAETVRPARVASARAVASSKPAVPAAARAVPRRRTGIPVAPAVAVPARPVVAASRPAAAVASAAVERPARTVDLTQPGKWTERQTAAADVPMRAYVTEELVADQRAERDEIEHTSEFELDLILGRAVGE